MIKRYSYKFKLRLNKTQKSLIEETANIVRFTYNYVLNKRKNLWNRNIQISPTKFVNILTKLKKREKFSFLNNVYSPILQQSIRDQNTTMSNFLRKLRKIGRKDYSEGTNTSFPKFRSKKALRDSFRYPWTNSIRLVNNHIYLPKIGWLKFYRSRNILGKPKNVTIVQDGNAWYICINVEEEIPDQELSRKPSVAIDIGVSSFATLSTGQSFNSIRKRLNKVYTRLEKQQRRLSQKVKGSSNYLRCKTKVQTLHRKLRNIRNDFLHKVSRIITNTYNVVFIENLNVKGMTKSAKGDLENPGTNVKQKSGLNRSILSEGWSRFFTYLTYKLKWKGGECIKVRPNYTSQTCIRCGYTHKENRISQSKFICQKCNLHIHADYNAALNIHTLGLREIHACGDGIPSLKQEPLHLSVIPIS